MTQVNRIPGQDLTDCQAWPLPEIDDSDNIVPCAEKEDRERREQEAQRLREVVGEELEIDADEPLTAEKLREIVEYAQRDGYADGYKQGHDEGHRKGYNDGRQHGLDETRQQVQQQQQRISQLLTALLDPCDMQTDRLEVIVLHTVTMLARSIVQRELLTDSTDIVNFVQQAIQALPIGSDNITLFLNPDDMLLVEEYVVEQGSHWQIRADTNLMPGGCRVQTQQSVVDFSVEARLAALCERFINGELREEGSEGDTTENSTGTNTSVAKIPGEKLSQSTGSEFASGNDVRQSQESFNQQQLRSESGSAEQHDNDDN